jgi:hypothetical protein
VEQELAELDRPKPPPAPLPDDPRLTARAATLSGEARAGDAAFDAALAVARRAAAQAGGTGSDSWVEAQQALSRAEAARLRTTAALAELDAFTVAQANARPPVSAADIERLVAAVAEAQALADSQQERIERLRAALT